MPLSTLYIRGVFFLLGGKLLPLQGDRLASINNPGWCPGLGASALSGRTVYIGASVLSGHAVYIGASVLSGRTVYNWSISSIRACCHSAPKISVA